MHFGVLTSFSQGSFTWYSEKLKDCDNTRISVMMNAGETFCILPLKYGRTLNDEYIDLVLTRRDPCDHIKGLFCKNSESVCSFFAALNKPGTPLLLVSNQKQSGKSMAKGVVFVERQVLVQHYISEHPDNDEKLMDIQRQKQRKWPVLLLLCDLRICFREPIEFPSKTHSEQPRNSLAWLITNLGLKDVADALAFAVVV